MRPMLDNSLLPESQFDSEELREVKKLRYAQAMRHNRSGQPIHHNLRHVTMAMDILQVARCIESIGDSEGVNPKILLDIPIRTIFKIKNDGTWEGYRKYILEKYNVDMGEVPDGTEKPSASLIYGTIQNWLNGEPLLFY